MKVSLRVFGSGLLGTSPGPILEVLIFRKSQRLQGLNVEKQADPVHSIHLDRYKASVGLVIYQILRNQAAMLRAMFKWIWAMLKGLASQRTKITRKKTSPCPNQSS